MLIVLVAGMMKEGGEKEGISHLGPPISTVRTVLICVVGMGALTRDHTKAVARAGADCALVYC